MKVMEVMKVMDLMEVMETNKSNYDNDRKSTSNWISNNNILALDLGTTTGFAMLDSSNHISSGSISFKATKFEGGGMPYLRFKRWLTEMKEGCGYMKEGCSYSPCCNHIDAIYFEEVRRHIGTDAAHKYGGFLAHLCAWAEHHQIPYQGVAVGTIKKHIAGKGNASKEEVIAAVRGKGFVPKDDNEADALALLDYVITRYHTAN